MLKLLFHLSGQLCSIDAAQVLEILPAVPLDPIQSAPEYMAGFLQYRGNRVPVIDLSHLISGKAAPKKLSTRIVLIDTSKNSATRRPLGLMCERVTDTTHKNSDLPATDLEMLLPRSMYDFLFDFAKR
jgi:chemotaxis-related protein WspB